MEVLQLVEAPFHLPAIHSPFLYIAKNSAGIHNVVIFPCCCPQSPTYRLLEKKVQPFHLHACPFSDQVPATGIPEVPVPALPALWTTYVQHSLQLSLHCSSLPRRSINPQKGRCPVLPNYCLSWFLRVCGLDEEAGGVSQLSWPWCFLCPSLWVRKTLESLSGIIRNSMIRCAHRCHGHAAAFVI